jgi:hypothetical protein
MMYKISFNYTDYKNLDIDLEELMFSVGESLGGIEAFDMYSWDNISLKEHWVDVGGKYIDVDGLPTNTSPSITAWNGANLVLSPKAYDAIGNQLADYGEFLPITIDGVQHYFFNCLNVVKSDPKQSEADIQNDVWLGIKKIGFKQADVDSNLVFKSKFDRCSSLYCGQAFKNLIESSELEGLLFIEDLVDGF